MHFAALKSRKNKLVKTDYNAYKFKISEILKYGAIGAAAGILVCWLCYHDFRSLPLAALIMVLYLLKKKKDLKEERKKRLLYHFKEFLSALNSALNSGYSIDNGLIETTEDMKKLYGEDDVIVNELKIMIAGLKLRKTVEELFYDLGERSGTDDIRLFAELLAIGKHQGGSINKIISDIRYIICEKIETEQEIDKQMAAKKYEHKIMSLVPACIIIYLRLTFDGFIEQLYGSFEGAVIMTGCLAAYAGAYVLGTKIVSIAV